MTTEDSNLKGREELRERLTRLRAEEPSDYFNLETLARDYRNSPIDDVPLPKASLLTIFDVMQAYQEPADGETGLDELTFLKLNLPRLGPVMEELNRWGNYGGGLTHSEVLPLLDNLNAHLADSQNEYQLGGVVPEDTPGEKVSPLVFADRLRTHFDARVSKEVPAHLGEYIAEIVPKPEGDGVEGTDFGKALHQLSGLGITVDRKGRWHSQRGFKVTYSDGTELRFSEGDKDALAERLRPADVKLALAALNDGAVSELSDYVLDVPSNRQARKSPVPKRDFAAYERAAEELVNPTGGEEAQKTVRLGLFVEPLTTDSLAKYCLSDKATLEVVGGKWVDKADNDKILTEEQALVRLRGTKQGLQHNRHDPHSYRLDRGTPVGDLAHMPYDLGVSAVNGAKGLWEAVSKNAGRITTGFVVLGTLGALGLAYNQNYVSVSRAEFEALEARANAAPVADEMIRPDYGAGIIAALESDDAKTALMDEVMNYTRNEGGAFTSIDGVDICMVNDTETALGYLSQMTTFGTKPSKAQLTEAAGLIQDEPYTIPGFEEERIFGKPGKQDGDQAYVCAKTE